MSSKHTSFLQKKKNAFFDLGRWGPIFGRSREALKCLLYLLKHVCVCVSLREIVDFTRICKRATCKCII